MSGCEFSVDGDRSASEQLGGCPLTTPAGLDGG
jgi:hypothetical protein